MKAYVKYKIQNQNLKLKSTVQNQTQNVESIMKNGTRKNKEEDQNNVKT